LFSTELKPKRDLLTAGGRSYGRSRGHATGRQILSASQDRRKKTKGERLGNMLRDRVERVQQSERASQLLPKGSKGRDPGRPMSRKLVPTVKSKNVLAASEGRSARGGENGAGAKIMKYSAQSERQDALMGLRGYTAGPFHRAGGGDNRWAEGLSARDLWNYHMSQI